VSDINPTSVSLIIAAIDRLGERLDRRMDGIDTRLSGIDTRLSGIDTRLDTLFGALADLRRDFDQHYHPGAAS
jgi:hypothetical protein